MTTFEGYIDVDAGAFGPGVIEGALTDFLHSGGEVVYHSNPADVLGRVVKVSGRGERVEVTAQLDRRPATARLRDVVRKIKTGTIKCLVLDGEAEISGGQINALTVTALSVTPLAIDDSRGFITAVAA
jgi:hypothetical protein